MQRLGDAENVEEGSLLGVLKKGGSRGLERWQGHGAGGAGGLRHNCLERHSGEAQNRNTRGWEAVAGGGAGPTVHLQFGSGVVRFSAGSVVAVPLPRFQFCSTALPKCDEQQVM